MEESSYSSESLIEADQACKYVMETITTIREELQIRTRREQE